MPVTTATDVYALGVLLYLLLTGQHPAGAGPHSPADLVKAIVDTEPLRVSDVVARRPRSGERTTNAARRATTPDKLRRLLRGDLDTIVAKALKKNPQERYASVTAFADDLRRYLKHEPISARPDTLAYRTAKFVRRNRTAVALAALAFLAAVAGVVGTLIQARTARAQRDFAFRQLSRAEAINDLNSFLLSDAAPSGKPFTVDDLLARAEHIVERQPGEDTIRVELLIAIGRQYTVQDEYAKARRLLEEAYRLSRALPERSTRAMASCALADRSVQNGRTWPCRSALSRGDRDPLRRTAARGGSGLLSAAGQRNRPQPWRCHRRLLPVPRQPSVCCSNRLSSPSCWNSTPSYPGRRHTAVPGNSARPAPHSRRQQRD